MARYLMALLVASLGLASCSQPEPPASPVDELTESYRAAVTDYARLLMVDHKAEEAFGKYYADLLIQHDPWIADGGKGDAEFLKQRREAEPDKYDATEDYVTVVHTILAEKDLVSIVSHVFTSPTDKGREFIDIWRLENGKFAEHWDIIQPLDATSAKVTGCGVGGTYAAAKAVGDTVARPTCGSPDPKGDREANRRLVLDHLKASAQQDAAAARTSQIERTVADGDFVLVHRRVTTKADPRGTAHADLYRVRDGKIADHWDVVQPIPEFSASGRSMTGGPDSPLEPGRIKRAARPGE